MFALAQDKIVCVNVCMTDAPKIPVSYGEIVDKLTILDIKLANAKEPVVVARLEGEASAIASAVMDQTDLPSNATPILRRVNEVLFTLEDRIRAQINRGDFGPSFVLNSIMIREYNDLRALIKRFINEVTNSPIVEEKIYDGGDERREGREQGTKERQ